MSTGKIERILRGCAAAVALCGLLAVFADGYDVDGNPLTRETLFGNVDGSKSTVGQVADFGNGGGSSIDTNGVVEIAKALKPRRLGGYLWEIGTEGEDWAKATNRMAQVYPSYSNGCGGCTGVATARYHGRNLDWGYNQQASILVRSPAREGKYGSIGVADGLLTDAFLESEAWTNAYYSLPFSVGDGLNEHGVVIQQNVVPKTLATNHAWHVKSDTRFVICFCIVRYALDRCTNALQAANLVNDRIFVPTEFNYDFHYLVSDRTGANYIVEDGTVYAASTNRPTDIMTNFRVGVDTTFTTNGLPNWETVEPHGSGLERYENARTNGYDKTTLGGMVSTMTELWFSKAYLPTTTPYWYTEHCDSDVAEFTVMNAKTNNATAAWTADIAQWYTNYTNEHNAAGAAYRGGETWQTTHTAVYDKDALALYLYTQEDPASGRLFYLKEGTDVTRGFATTNWVLSQGYVTETVTNGLTSFVSVTNISSATVSNVAPGVVSNVVPEWALSKVPPEGMTTNALIYTNNVVMTKDGTHTVDILGVKPFLKAMTNDTIQSAFGMNVDTNSLVGQVNTITGLLINASNKIVRITSNVVTQAYIADRGFVVGMSPAWTNGVAGVVTNDVDPSYVAQGTLWSMGQVCTNKQVIGEVEQMACMTNMGVRWNGSVFQMHLVGTRIFDNVIIPIDIWYTCAKDIGDEVADPYTIPNDNLNSTNAAPLIHIEPISFSANESEQLVAKKIGVTNYTVTLPLRNQWGLAYLKDVKVDSVNGQTGSVTIAAGDLLPYPTNEIPQNAVANLTGDITTLQQSVVEVRTEALQEVIAATNAIPRAYITDGTNVVKASREYGKNEVRKGKWVFTGDNGTTITLTPQLTGDYWVDSDTQSAIYVFSSEEGVTFWEFFLNNYRDFSSRAVDDYSDIKITANDPSHEVNYYIGRYVPDTTLLATTNDLASAVAGYMPLSGGAVTGEVDVVLDDTRYQSGPYVRIGENSNSGGYLRIGVDSFIGGIITVGSGGGSGNGGSIVVQDGNISSASIKKGEKEVATEDQVNALPTYLAVTNAAGAVATNVYAAMPTTYAATNAVVALNQSVQYAVASGTEIAITPPSAVDGGVRDWVLYLNGTAETALNLSAFSGLLAADAAYTNAVASNVVTVLYFSEITNGVFHLSRQELTPVK